ncbi:MAG: hypothetical protein ABFS43_14410 [Thermodesulfobacteriota bacterium]
MIDILETYEPPKLSDDVLKNVRSIVKEAEGELGVDGGTNRRYCIRLKE